MKIKNLLHKHCSYVTPVPTSHSPFPISPIHPAAKNMVSPLIIIITYIYTQTYTLEHVIQTPESVNLDNVTAIHACFRIKGNLFSLNLELHF